MGLARTSREFDSDRTYETGRAAGNPRLLSLLRVACVRGRAGDFSVAGQAQARAAHRTKSTTALQRGTSMNYPRSAPTLALVMAVLVAACDKPQQQGLHSHRCSRSMPPTRSTPAATSSPSTTSSRARRRWPSRAARSWRWERGPMSRRRTRARPPGSSISAARRCCPAFLDAHSHYFSSLTVANQVNVYAPPAGPGKDPASIVAELVKYRDANKIPTGEVIQAYGYDENVMPKGQPAQSRRPRQGAARQPGAGRARVDAWRGAELGGDEEVGHLRQDQDAAGRRDRAQAGHPGALRPDHGDGLPADLRVVAAADRRSRRSSGPRPGSCCTRSTASPPRTRARPTSAIWT